MKTLNALTLPSFLTGVLGSIGYLTASFNGGLSLFCFVLAFLMAVLFFVNAINFTLNGRATLTDTINF